MKATDLATLARHSACANRRLLRRVGSMDRRALLRRTCLSHRSLLGTLVHLVHAQWYWRTGVQTGVLPTNTLTTDDFPSMAALHRRWKAEDSLLLEFVDGLSDRQAARPAVYRWGRARPRRRPLWHVILHVVNHGTHHRAEAGAYLATLDRSPGDLGLVRFVRFVRST